ncbi:hypothetical protein [Oceanobacillus saliphilus]|uniref:hypothetical protein n=1 Tax=Oceanobacillus saliphilus TaxID=2925834 RepID=UPI00201D9EE4|nr:hypothetical protein [Oceanobacillus saliphilus]
MSVLVVNCNQWLGYHVVNVLLENDYNVRGIAGNEKGHSQDNESMLMEDDLSLFFGRNSSFTMIAPDENKTYDIGIIAGDYEHKLNQKVGKLFVINPRTEQIRLIKHGSCTIIKVPLLFGEWMPMNEEGIFLLNEFIPFTSDYFKETAVYAGDFVRALIQWLEIPALPSVLHVYSSKYERNTDTILDKAIYLRDNMPISEKVKSVVNHYRSFRKLNN